MTDNKEIKENLADNEPKLEEKNGQEQENQGQESELEQLTKKIADLEEKAAKADERALRALAEADNVRRRSGQEQEKLVKYAISNFVNDLIVVVENFFLASNNAPKEEIEKSEKIKNYADAITMTENELVKVLEKNGVKRLFPVGEEFNHNIHEAVSQIESEEKEGTVLQVVQAGYTINERLLKPALVVVAKPKDS